MRVDAVEALLPSGEIGHHGRVEVIDLADREEIGIRGLQALQVCRPERTRDVGESIDAEAVDAADLHPPVGVLLQVLGGQRVLLRQVGKNVREPAIESAAIILLHRMRVGHWRIIVVRVDVVGGGSVQPIGRRLRSGPRMLRPNVVRNHVEQNLDSLLVGGVNQLLKLLQRTEVVFDRVEIGGAVSVVALARFVVVENGIQPQRGDTQILEIRQMVLNALEVSAVIGLGSLAGRTFPAPLLSACCWWDRRRRNGRA